MNWDYFKYVDTVLSKEHGLTPSQRLLLTTMARYGKHCWASYATLAARTGLHRVTVIHTAQTLAITGWLAKASDKGWVLLVASDNQLREATGSVEQPNGSVGLQEGSVTQPPLVASDNPIELIERVTKEPRKNKRVDEPFILRMVGKHEKELGGDVGVREEINKAMNHTALKKAIDIQLYVQNWLNNSVKFKTERNGKNQGPGSVPTAESIKDQLRQRGVRV